MNTATGLVPVSFFCGFFHTTGFLVLGSDTFLEPLKL